VGHDPGCDATLRDIFGPDLEAGVRRLASFLEALGVSTDPAEHGVSPAEWPRLVAKAMQGERGKNFIGRPEVRAA
jgi:alcohol dehydrogenase